ncbi:MAG TPA: FAD-dependent oxidoreductase [Acidimicrobiales bacterium]
MFDHEVIVVGGGAMGAATAWQLARAGRDVALVEQFEVGHVHGSSHGHTRIFRIAYRDPRYSAFALAALDWWRVLEDESASSLVELCGQIDHGAPAALDDVAIALDHLGRPHQRLSAAAAARRWPGIRTAGGALFSPDGGYVAADRSVATLHRVAAERGATIHTGVAVRRIEPAADGGGATVVTDDGSWSAPVVVVAAGAWAGGLLDGLVDLPPLTVTLAVPSHFRPVPAAGSDRGDPWPSVVHYAPDGAPLGFGAYAVWAPGVGMKVGLEEREIPVDLARRRYDPPPEEVAALAAYVREWFPGLDPDPLDPHTCLFTSTPDEHFILDRRGPVVVVSPCSGHGFKFVPAVGQVAAAMALSSDPTAADVDRLDAWRLT